VGFQLSPAGKLHNVGLWIALEDLFPLRFGQ
jgi:hypothetical protein